MPAISERRQWLIRFARDEINRYRHGEVNRISSIDEISLQFGLGKPRIYEVFSKAKLTQQRRVIEHEARLITLPHSRDTAWMLGILTAGGNTRIRDGAEGVVRFAHKDEHIRNRFRALGEKIFKSGASPRLSVENTNGKKPTDIVSFHNIHAARAVGDMRRDVWPTTLRRQHPWILQKPEFVWGFLEGFFEERGRLIHRYQKGEISQHQLHLQTSSLQGVLFLREVLAVLGIHRISPLKSTATNSGIAGICISNIPEIKLFAENVHSLNVQKENLLDYYRRKSTKRVGYTDDNIIQEWIDVVGQLGRYPNSDDIRRLRKERKTRFSVGLYANRFGGKKRSFSAARAYLETIVPPPLNPGIGIRNNIGLIGRFIAFHDEAGKRYARVAFPSGFQSLFPLETFGIKFHVVPPEEEENYIQDDKTASRKIHNIVNTQSNPFR